MEFVSEPLFFGVVVTVFYVPLTYIFYRRLIRKAQFRRFASGVRSIMRSQEGRTDSVNESIMRIEMLAASGDFSSGDYGAIFSLERESTVDLMERIFAVIHSEDSEDKEGSLKSWDEEDERSFDPVLMEMKRRQPFASLSGEFQNLLTTLKEEAGSRGTPSLVVDQVGEKVKSLEAKLRRQRAQNLLFGVVSAAGVVFSVLGFFN